MLVALFMPWQYMRDSMTLHQRPLAGGGDDDADGGSDHDAVREGAVETVKRLLQGIEVQAACGVPACGFAIEHCEFVRIGGALLPPVSAAEEQHEAQAQAEQEGGGGSFRFPWGSLSQFEHFNGVTLRDYVVSQYGWEADHLNPMLCPDISGAEDASRGGPPGGGEAALPPAGTQLAHGAEVWLCPCPRQPAARATEDGAAPESAARREVATVMLPPSHVAVSQAVTQHAVYTLLRELNWCRLRLLLIGQRKAGEGCLFRLLDDDTLHSIATLVLTESSSSSSVGSSDSG